MPSPVVSLGFFEQHGPRFALGTPTGPLFALTASSRMKAEMRNLVKGLLAAGERFAKLNLFRGHGVITGHYRRSIHGEMTGSLHGVLHDSKVIYGPFLEFGAGSGGKFKGYRTFQLAGQHMQKIAEQKMGKAGRKMVKNLGG